jgi:hypothetical protein
LCASCNKNLLQYLIPAYGHLQDFFKLIFFNSLRKIKSIASVRMQCREWFFYFFIYLFNLARVTSSRRGLLQRADIWKYLPRASVWEWSCLWLLIVSDQRKGSELNHSLVVILLSCSWNLSSTINFEFLYL